MMSKSDKLINRLLRNPKDFSFDEMKTILESLGFVTKSKGKTGGSRVKFMKENITINLHKPHPRKDLLEYQIKQILEKLEKEELL